jgi:hypothetical protein
VTARILHQLRKRFTTRALAQSVQPRITANAWRKIFPVRFPQGLDERVAALLADFPVVIAASLIETDIAVILILPHKWPSSPARKKKN